MKGRHTHVSAPHGSIAPMHRGPQAVSQGSISGTHVHAPNAALLIDFDNVTMGIRSDLGHELRNLLGSDIIKGKVAVQRAYADWRRYPQYIVPLAESSIDMIMAPAYGSSKKNATDIRLAIDAMELIFTRPEIGTFILLSGDSDFSSLVMKIKEYGKYVIGVGIRESSSDLLVQNCDEYYSYNALAGLIKNGEVETTKKWDPWELVTEAINRMVQNHDVMRSDRLKQVMQEIDSGFDEKDLGMSKFSKFCQEAAHKGLIRATKLENGQLEVSPVSASPSAARPGRSERPAPSADAVAGNGAEERVDGDSPGGAPREGRSRRGRRGGRGRKRGGPAGVVGATGEFATPESGMIDAPTRFDAPTTFEASADVVESVSDFSEEDAVPAPASAPVSAQAPAPRAARPARPARLAARPAAPRVAALEADDSIGVSGLRLTRDEAMGLVRGAVASLTEEDDAVPDEKVRQQARALLGRDSESLSVKNFSRILRDAHDNDIVDLRRRGDGFEVAKAAAAPSVADQLAVREREVRAAEPQAAAAPPAPRGMGPRGAPARGRSGPAVRNAPPPGLLMVGVVDEPAAAADAEKPARRPRRPRRSAGGSAGTGGDTAGDLAL